jgi:hypothetical protein
MGGYPISLVFRSSTGVRSGQGLKAIHLNPTKS